MSKEIEEKRERVESLFLMMMNAIDMLSSIKEEYNLAVMDLHNAENKNVDNDFSEKKPYTEE